jgi:hypothetical protein
MIELPLGSSGLCGVADRVGRHHRFVLVSDPTASVAALVAGAGMLRIGAARVVQSGP